MLWICKYFFPIRIRGSVNLNYGYGFQIITGPAGSTWTFLWLSKKNEYYKIFNLFLKFLSNLIKSKDPDQQWHNYVSGSRRPIAYGSNGSGSGPTSLLICMKKIKLKGGFLSFNVRYLKTASSAAPQIPLCRRLLRSNPGLLRLWHWQPDALTARLDLIYEKK